MRENPAAYSRSMALLSAVSTNNTVEALRLIPLIPASFINQTTPDAAKATALHLAMGLGNTEIALALLKSGADSLAKNSKQETTVRVGVSAKRWSTVVATAEARALTPNEKSEYGWAMLDAVFYGEKDSALKLIEAGASLTWEYVTTRDMAIHTAAGKGYTDLAVALLKAGADSFVTNKAMITPIIAAINSKCWSTAVAMAEARPLTTAEKSKYGLVLLGAIDAGEISVALRLIEAGVSLDIYFLDTDNEDRALHKAAAKGYKILVEALLDAGASFTEANKNSKTAIDEAFTAGFHEIVAMFLRQPVVSEDTIEILNQVKAVSVEVSKGFQKKIDEAKPEERIYFSADLARLQMLEASFRALKGMCEIEATEKEEKAIFQAFLAIKLAFQCLERGVQDDDTIKGILEDSARELLPAFDKETPKVSSKTPFRTENPYYVALKEIAANFESGVKRRGIDDDYYYALFGKVVPDQSPAASAPLADSASAASKPASAGAGSVAADAEEHPDAAKPIAVLVSDPLQLASAPAAGSVRSSVVTSAREEEPANEEEADLNQGAVVISDRTPVTVAPTLPQASSSNVAVQAMIAGGIFASAAPAPAPAASGITGLDFPAVPAHAVTPPSPIDSRDAAEGRLLAPAR